MHPSLTASSKEIMEKVCEINVDFILHVFCFIGKIVKTDLTVNQDNTKSILCSCILVFLQSYIVFLRKYKVLTLACCSGDILSVDIF